MKSQTGGGTARKGEKGRGIRGIEEGFLLVVTKAAREALNPSEIAAGVNDESGILAAYADGDDVV